MTRSKAITALACLAGLALPSAAGAATNGRIAFTAFDGKRPQIYTVNPDGSGVTQVTHVKGPQAPQDPTWSPDGTAIAYGVDAETHADVFTIKPDGSGLLKLAFDANKYHGALCWSPDGRQVAVDTDSGKGQPDVHGIFVANADGSGTHRLTTPLKGKDAYDTECDWSPDGTRIAFMRVKSKRDAAIFTVRTDGSDLKQVTPYKLDAAVPDWSPDGTKIAFNSYWDPHPGKSANIYTVGADGTGLTNITRHRDGKTHAFRPSWAPDGTKIALARYTPKGKQGRFDLYTINPDGSGAKRITTMPFAGQPDWGTAS